MSIDGYFQEHGWTSFALTPGLTSPGIRQGPGDLLSRPQWEAQGFGIEIIPLLGPAGTARAFFPSWDGQEPEPLPASPPNPPSAGTDTRVHY